MTIKPLVAAALTLAGIALAPAAQAQRYGYGYGYDQPRYEQSYRGDHRPSGYGYDRGYGYERGYGEDARRYDGRGYRRCSSGTTGTLLGALAGGLLGRSIDGRGDRALGTVLGAGAGALAGHAVEKSGNPGYCR
jgi:hypothetical protein